MKINSRLVMVTLPIGMVTDCQLRLTYNIRGTSMVVWRWRSWASCRVGADEAVVGHGYELSGLWRVDGRRFVVRR